MHAECRGARFARFVTVFSEKFLKIKDSQGYISSMDKTQPVTPTGTSVSTRLVPLQPGLYLFRYAEQRAPNEGLPVTVTAAPIGRGIVDFFPGEGVSRNTLSNLGDCLVVRVLRGESAALIATFQSRGVDVDLESLVQIDRVDTTGKFVRANKQAARAGGRTPQSSFEPATGEEATLNLLGHIQNRGDVRSTGGDWLGDPSSRMRLEGFVVEWPSRPKDVELFYTGHVQGQGQTPPVRAGQFMGTRQKGAPITSLSFALTGPAAKQYQLSGQVAFQGASPMAIVNERRLAGPTGAEPLVAVRLRIFHQQGAATTSRYPSPWDDPAVTQIFRSSNQAR